MIQSGKDRTQDKAKRVATRHTTIGQQKVARVLRDELADIISTCDIKATVYPDESLLRAVSIADIEFSSDLGIAKVYISILGNSVERRQVYVWLCNNMGQIRYSLSQRLKSLRRLPELKFALVDSQSSFQLSDVMEEFAPDNRISANEVEFEEVDEDDW
jgi:ribosome-binding factor A